MKSGNGMVDADAAIALAFTAYDSGRREGERRTLTDRYEMRFGTAALQFPVQISADEIEDMKEWLSIVTRKLERLAAGTEQKPNLSSNESVLSSNAPQANE